ncbi:hypothetical protein QTI33_28200 [Variovorax sp. J22P271]|uniref:hypothetical protein n=1 Tax=Variovorax davisae TaxID=3053515 RepID=UPI0025749562|nr:hypothetical protein [Variovorax sp. J22P271]MDM0036048.1 hypothetical protein [Variovorax sp. J22P271]
MALVHSSGLRIDAYLAWAMQPGVRLFDRSKSTHATLLVRFEHPLTFARIEQLNSRTMRCSKIFEGYAHATVTVPIDSLDDRLDELQAAGAVYCELATPAAPVPNDLPMPDLPALQPGPDTVIGIIDDGCPFAHQAYRPGSAASVRFIWDMGGTPGTGPVPGDPPFFNYGAEYTHQIGQIVNMATTAQGVNEDSAYALIGLPSLRAMASHGAQVMSHAAGCARPIDGRSMPPLAGRTDLAFVQLPTAALDDPSGLWLKQFGYEGLQAIFQYARKRFQPPAGKVLVNLSYGPQTGPHDGSSFMESAIEEMTEKARLDNCIFRVVLPSGNNHLLRSHAEVQLNGLDAVGRSFDWNVAADSQTHAQLEIWLPTQVTLNHVDVRAQSPTGEIALLSAPPPPGTVPEPTVRITASEVPAPPLPTSLPPFEQTQMQITVSASPTARAPTDAASTAPARLATPGRWRVTLLARQAGVDIQGTAHVYLARSDPNMGRPLRGRSGHLGSPHCDDPCGTIPSEQLDPDAPHTGLAEVFARGSLSGIATGAESLVAGGYRIQDDLPAPYSSGGPCRPLAPRDSPNWAYPVEQSRVLPGLLGRGNRSGVSMRFSGTSIAAPQLVRELAATPGSDLPPLPPPVPPPPSWFRPRFGGGRR